MVIDYPDNDQSLIVQYHHTRTGPDYILILYKHVSRIVLDVKALKAVLGSAKFLDSSKKIYAWAQELIDKYSHVEEEARADTSFASPEVEDADPTKDTKMII